MSDHDRTYSSKILAAPANNVLNIDIGHIYVYRLAVYYRGFNALSLGAGGSFPHWEGGTGVPRTKAKANQLE